MRALMHLYYRKPQLDLSLFFFFFFFFFFKLIYHPKGHLPVITPNTRQTHTNFKSCAWARSKNKQKAEPFGTYDQRGKSPVSMPFKMDNMQTEHVECVTSKMYHLSWHAWLTQPRVWALMSDTVHSYLRRTLTPKCSTIRDTQHFLPTFFFFVCLFVCFLCFFFNTILSNTLSPSVPLPHISLDDTFAYMHMHCTLPYMFVTYMQKRQ